MMPLQESERMQTRDHIDIFIAKNQKLGFRSPLVYKSVHRGEKPSKIYD